MRQAIAIPSVLLRKVEMELLHDSVSRPSDVRVVRENCHGHIINAAAAETILQSLD